MKKVTKVISMLLVAAMVFAMAACGGPVDPSSSSNAPSSTPSKPNQDKPQDNKVSFTVKVQSVGGMPLADIDLALMDGSTMLDVGSTDDKGMYIFKAAAGKQYSVQVSGVPKGYSYEQSYDFNGNSCVITLASSVITNEKLSSSTKFKPGDIMYDFTFTDTLGVTYTISEVLKEKKMVMLNFWNKTCGYCKEEFPVINSVYNQYKDQIEIFGLNDNGELLSDAEAWKVEMSLDLPMGLSNSGLGIGSFGMNGRPTTVIIDRYGMVAMVHAGAITSDHVWENIFLHFTAEKYDQKIINEYKDLVPKQEVTEKFPGSDAIGEAINSGELDVTYLPDEGSTSQFTWPFIVTDYNGESCIKASNSAKDSTSAMIRAKVTLKAGQAVGFDYLISSELASDVAVVIVNGEDIYQMSGYDENPQWNTCYPWVALEDGVYEVAVVYLKDGTKNHGDDTIYIDNLRVVDAEDIEVDCYIPRQAAVENEDGTFDYVDAIFNPADGYYHVGTMDGPLLLANLMGYTKFCEDDFVYNMAQQDLIIKNGHNYKNDLTPFASYASNSSLEGYCTVTAELAEILKVVAEIRGYEGTENEWLKICEYYEAYGPNGTHLEDPIKGLAPFSAPEAVLGKWELNEETNEFVFTPADSELPAGEYNFFYYDRVIMPRGKFYKFTPSVSGVYRITSHATAGVEAWIFTEESFNNRAALYTYEGEERINLADGENLSMVYYMEAGKSYYINIAFWDVAGVGYVPFDLEFVGETYRKFQHASPGFFTLVEGTNSYYLSGGIEIYFNEEDGIYYHWKTDENGNKLTDENGNPVLGGPLYVDFTMATKIMGVSILDYPLYDQNGNPVLNDEGEQVYGKGIISMGGFDFSKNEYDEEILAYLARHDGNVDATRDYLKRMWGEDYDDYAEVYDLENIFAGNYHGNGEDLTDEILAFVDDVIYAEGELHDGCALATKELVELLQVLMDKYTFPGVVNSWAKLCYYYEDMGL